MDLSTKKDMKRAESKIKHYMKMYFTNDEIKSFADWSKDEVELKTTYLRLDLYAEMQKPRSKLYKIFDRSSPIWKGEAVKQLLFLYQDYLKEKNKSRG